MVNLNLLMGILEDYCHLQTSGQISGAGRYAVSDVQEQLDLLETDEVKSVFDMALTCEATLATVVLKQRQLIAKLQAHVAVLEKTAGVVDSLVDSMAPAASSQVH